MTWNSETNIKGPPGPPGPQGIQGPPGASGTGTGNVTGPAGAVADRIAVYNGTSGTVIKDGGKTIAELGGSAASGITVTPAGNIAATNVQAALVELDNEKVAKAGDTMTGNLQISKANPALVLQKTASGQTNQFVGYNDVNARWQIQMGDSVAESGSNAGSNFTIARYSDAGAPIDAPLAIARSTGIVDFKTTPTVSGVPLGSGGSGVTLISDIRPDPLTTPIGSTWFETDTGLFFVLYNDGTSKQWVHVPGGITDAVRYATGQSLTSAQMSQARANIAVTKKNYVINGGMQISQENGGTAGTANAYYPVDQFLMSWSNAGTQTAQNVVSITPGNSTSRLRVTATAADAAVGAGDVLQILQKIEGVRVADLRLGTTTPKTFTLQFGVKAPAGTYCVSFSNSNGTRSYIAEYVIAAGEANNDVVKSVTITGDIGGSWDTGFNAGLCIAWTLMCGTTYQQAAGSWGTIPFALGSSSQFNFMGTLNNTFELFDVSLTEGTVAPPFQLPDYASELALCMRYWTCSDPITPKGGGNTGHVAVISTGTDRGGGAYAFKVPMRAPPTVTCWLNGVQNKLWDGVAGAVVTPGAFTPQQGTATGMSWGYFASGLTAGRNYYFDLIANARL